LISSMFLSRVCCQEFPLQSLSKVEEFRFPFKPKSSCSGNTPQHLYSSSCWVIIAQYSLQYWKFNLANQLA